MCIVNSEPIMLVINSEPIMLVINSEPIMLAINCLKKSTSCYIYAAIAFVS
jgi:hypothetical protein